MLQGKNIVLGITGSIAAYKVAGLASLLMKQHANVTVIMTKNATNFINPITFETLTGNKCLIDTFDRNFQYNVEHVALAKKTDVFLVAPASANVIAKLANGIADDMLTTTFLACTCPKIIAPAMNTNMFLNPIVQENISKLEHFGMKVISPGSGYLACGDIGIGKMPEPEVLLEYLLFELSFEKDLKGKHVLITAGATKEKIDPVRYISNHSTGKMGYELARVCAYRGASVTLISGETNLKPPLSVQTIYVTSASEMFEQVKEQSHADIIIKAAAVADYRPKQVSLEKIKKKDASLNMELEKTDDILKYLGEHKRDGQFLCGFSMETEHMLENSKAKFERKNLDMIVANNLTEKGAGFATDTNIVTLITKEQTIEFPLLSKYETAVRIVDEIKKKVVKKTIEL